MPRPDPLNGLIREIPWLLNKSTPFENATLLMPAKHMSNAMGRRCGMRPAGSPQGLERRRQGGAARAADIDSRGGVFAPHRLDCGRRPGLRRADRRRLMRWGARSRATLVDTSQDTRSTPAPTRMSHRSLVYVSHMDRQDRQDEPDGFLSLFILSILFIHVPFHPSMIFHRSSSKRMLLPKTSISSLLQVSRSEAQPR